MGNNLQAVSVHVSDELQAYAHYVNSPCVDLAREYEQLG